MKSRQEQLTWAKRRALICVDRGNFTDAVAGLRADLAENPLTEGVMSSDQALRGYKAAIDAALGRGSQALTGWIEEFRQSACRDVRPGNTPRRLFVMNRLRMPLIVQMSSFTLSVLMRAKADALSSLELLSVMTHLGNQLRSSYHLPNAKAGRAMSEGHWQLEGNAAELFQRYLVPAITSKWAEDLVRLARSFERAS